jgi:hypothetical protein
MTGIDSNGAARVAANFLQIPQEQIHLARSSVNPKNKFRIRVVRRVNPFCLCVSLHLNGHGNELPELLDANERHDSGRPLERTDWR